MSRAAALQQRNDALIALVEQTASSFHPAILRDGERKRNPRTDLAVRLCVCGAGPKEAAALAGCNSASLRARLASLQRAGRLPPGVYDLDGIKRRMRNAARSRRRSTTAQQVMWAFGAFHQAGREWREQDDRSVATAAVSATQESDYEVRTLVRAASKIHPRAAVAVAAIIDGAELAEALDEAEISPGEWASIREPLRALLA